MFSFLLSLRLDAGDLEIPRPVNKLETILTLQSSFALFNVELSKLEGVKISGTVPDDVEELLVVMSTRGTQMLAQLTEGSSSR